jgi:hypothetical protein
LVTGPVSPGRSLTPLREPRTEQRGRIDLALGAPDLAPGAPVEVWRASEQAWQPATIGTAEVLKAHTPPASAAVLCIFDGSRLQKWIRAEDTKTLIRPRRIQESAHHVRNNEQVAYVEPQTRPPLEYTVPQTRVPYGY